MSYKQVVPSFFPHSLCAIPSGPHQPSTFNCVVVAVVHSCPTLCNPIDCSTPGFPALHHLPELVQTHAHWVSDVIQPSHPLSSPSPPALNLSQHQGLFKWIGSSHQVAKVLEFQLQHQSFQWTLRTDLLYDGLVGSPCSPRDSQESSPTPYFKGINSSALMHSKNVEIENLTVYKMKWGRCCCSLFNDGFDI